MSQAQSYEYLWGTMRWRVLRKKLMKMDFTAGERQIAEIRAECDRLCQVIALRPVLREQLIEIIDSCVADGRYSAQRAGSVVLPDLTPFEEVIVSSQRTAGRPRKEGNEARIVNPSIRNAMAAILTQPQLAETEKLRRGSKRGCIKNGKSRGSQSRARPGGPVREKSVPIISLETVAVAPEKQGVDLPVMETGLQTVEAVEVHVEEGSSIPVPALDWEVVSSQPDMVHREAVFSQTYLDAMKAYAEQDPMDTSEMSDLEIRDHCQKHGIPLRRYPELFTPEEESEMAALADRSVWPASYDHDWAKDWPKDPLTPMPIMVEEFPHFGMNANEPLRKWHALRDAGREAGQIEDVKFKDVPDPLEGMSEETAWNWIGPSELPRPPGFPRVSPEGRYFSLGSPLQEMLKTQRLRAFRGSAKTVLLNKLVKYTELATMNVSFGRLFGHEFDVNWQIEQEGYRQRLWAKVLQRVDLIRYGMVRVGLGRMTIDAVKADVFQWDFDAMVSLSEDECVTYVRRILDKLPWPEGFSRRELVEALGHGQSPDEVMDMCQAAYQTPWQKVRSDAEDTLVASETEYEMI